MEETTLFFLSKIVFRQNSVPQIILHINSEQNHICLSETIYIAGGL